jgi:hypothetical protein
MKALFNSKVGGMPKLVNFILGLIMVAIGGLGIFGENLGITLPELPSIIFTILIALGGIVLLLDAFAGVGQDTMRGMPKKVNMTVGILVFLCGGALVLGLLAIIVLPEVPLLVLNAIILAAGIITLLDGIVGAKDTAGM